MSYIHIKSKNLKKIDDQEIALIIHNDMGKYEIFTKNMNKFIVKKKSQKDLKKLTKTLSYIKVQEHLWINSKLFKKENTFLMDKIREFYQKKPVIVTEKHICCCHCCHYRCTNSSSENDNEDNDDDFFYKKSSR